MTITSSLALFPLGLTQATPRASMDILWWLGAILGAVIVIVIVAVVLRRWLVTGDDDARQLGASGFTLGDLRDMHARGQLSDEEFEVARKGMIARSRAMLVTPEAEPPPAGTVGEDLAAPGTEGVDFTPDAAKHGQADPDHDSGPRPA